MPHGFVFAKLPNAPLGEGTTGLSWGVLGIGGAKGRVAEFVMSLTPDVKILDGIR